MNETIIAFPNMHCELVLADTCNENRTLYIVYLLFVTKLPYCNNKSK